MCGMCTVCLQRFTLFTPLSTHRNFLFEAKVLQIPADSAIEAGLQVEIRTTLSYQDPTLVFASDSRVFAIPGTSSRLPGEKYLSSGPDARSFVRDVLALCADAKLDILVTRLAVTLGTYINTFQSVRFFCFFCGVCFCLFVCF